MASVAGVACGTWFLTVAWMSSMKSGAKPNKNTRKFRPVALCRKRPCMTQRSSRPFRVSLDGSSRSMSIRAPRTPKMRFTSASRASSPSAWISRNGRSCAMSSSAPLRSPSHMASQTLAMASRSASPSSPLSSKRMSCMSPRVACIAGDTSSFVPALLLAAAAAVPWLTHPSASVATDMSASTSSLLSPSCASLLATLVLAAAAAAASSPMRAMASSTGKVSSDPSSYSTRHTKMEDISKASPASLPQSSSSSAAASAAAAAAGASSTSSTMEPTTESTPFSPTFTTRLPTRSNSRSFSAPVDAASLLTSTSTWW